jgi:hypothetical protein
LQQERLIPIGLTITDENQQLIPMGQVIPIGQR